MSTSEVGQILERLASLEKKIDALAERFNIHIGETEEKEKHVERLSRTLSSILGGVIVTALAAIGGFALKLFIHVGGTK